MGVRQDSASPPAAGHPILREDNSETGYDKPVKACSQIGPCSGALGHPPLGCPRDKPSEQSTLEACASQVTCGVGDVRGKGVGGGGGGGSEESQPAHGV